MSFSSRPPSGLTGFDVASRHPDRTARDDGDAQLVSFAGAASWLGSGAGETPGHGRGVLVISQDTVTFALHGGVRTFTHSGTKIALTRTPLAAVAVLEDGDTYVRVTVTGLPGRKLARTLGDAGLLA